MKKKAFRALIEMGFIIFLFYANLLMGEYERSGAGLQKQGFVWAVEDVADASQSFIIAGISSLPGIYYL